jgi:predicted permease
VIADLRHALRILKKSPGFAGLAILLLALGIGANTAMFSILDAWLLEPLHFPAPERLALILKSEVSNPTEPKIFAAYCDWEEWARQSHSFQNLAAVFWRSFEGKNGEEGLFGMIATACLFDVLGVKPERGRTFRPEDIAGAPVSVIGHELWMNRFHGAPDVLGQTIPLGSKNYQIIGVMPPAFGLRMIDQATDTQFYALIQKDEAPYSDGGIGPVAAVGRLKPGVAISSAQVELAGIQRSLDEIHRDNPKGYTVLATPLQKDNTRNVRASLWLSAAALGFVLLVVCANVGSLIAGRTLGRRREVAIRTALGSSRLRIVRQFLTENAVIAILGALGGVMIALTGIRVFAAVNPFGRMPPNPIAIDAQALAFTVLVALGSAIIFGLAPALEGTHVNLNQAMKASGRGIASAAGGLRLRGFLVSGQLALSLILVVGAALMTETLRRLESQPLGLRTEGVTVASVGISKERWNDFNARRLIYDRLLDKFKSLAGVEAVAISNAAPLAGSFEDRFSIEGRPAPTEDAAPRAGTQSITPGYFQTLGIPRIAGRGFTEHDHEDSVPVAILNRNAAERWFPGRSALAEHIKLRDDKTWRTIVGVVGDTSYTFYNTIEWLNGPRIFVPSRQAPNESVSPVARECYTVIRGQSMQAEIVRALLKSVDSELRLGKLQNLPDMVAEVVRQPRVRTQMLSAVAVFSLLLAAIGIYGVMAQSVIQRTQEIGIRMALGARSGDLVRMVVAQGLRLAAVGIAVGVVASLAMTRVIAGLLYGVKPTDIATFIGAALVLLIAVAMAALIPARAAARVDPLVALRQE